MNRDVMARRPIKSVDLKVWRPSEYTTWKPRREVGIGWTTYVFGIVRLVVNR